MGQLDEALLFRQTYKQLISDAAGEIEEGIEEALTESRRESRMRLDRHLLIPRVEIDDKYLDSSKIHYYSKIEFISHDTMGSTGSFWYLSLI